MDEGNLSDRLGAKTTALVSYDRNSVTDADSVSIEFASSYRKFVDWILPMRNWSPEDKEYKYNATSYVGETRNGKAGCHDYLCYDFYPAFLFEANKVISSVADTPSSLEYDFIGVGYRLKGEITTSKHFEYFKGSSLTVTYEQLHLSEWGNDSVPSDSTDYFTATFGQKIGDNVAVTVGYRKGDDPDTRVNDEIFRVGPTLKF